MVTPDQMMIEAPSLAAIDGVAHGFSTRLGGVSGGIYASLNCGPGSKDDPANVIENRARVAGNLGAAPDNLLTLYQRHTNIAVVAEKPWANSELPKADALVTAVPGLAIGVLTADCVPVLFCDPEARVLGAAHAGWRGALSGVVEATVDAMIGLGAKPKRIRAVVGPAISQCAYEVGQDYRQHFIAKDPDAAAFFVTDEGAGEPHFDLSGYAVERLARAGVGDIVDLRLCTYNDESRLFSYRRSQRNAENDYGRQISAIVLA
jgi:YfiH family protein